jgi:virulence-associated protein VagC
LAEPNRADATSFVVGLVSSMTTVKILETSSGQTVPLPEQFRFNTTVVSLRREGDAVILEPVKPSDWPPHFFEDIQIEDPAFARPAQGPLPPAPALD